MALIACAECNKQISDRAAACPSCGCPVAAGDTQAEATRPSASSTPMDSPENAQLNKVAAGQRIVIFAIVGMIAVVGLQFALIENRDLTPVFGYLDLAVKLVGIYGVITMAVGLGYSLLTRAIFIALFLLPYLMAFNVLSVSEGHNGFIALLPVVNFLIVLWVINAGSKALKKGGYKVGFLGAAPR